MKMQNLRRIRNLSKCVHICGNNLLNQGCQTSEFVNRGTELLVIGLNE
ncbi:rCG44624 [Rattus norvegicus]|uniref:RCG44624 n=1 Tax=Rattus norvegicus TaxID=10116 RepID=A6I4L6_RAT|nr:rCG44624 [Rattus norvegicus]